MQPASGGKGGSGHDHQSLPTHPVTTYKISNRQKTDRESKPRKPREPEGSESLRALEGSETEVHRLRQRLQDVAKIVHSLTQSESLSLMEDSADSDSEPEDDHDTDRPSLAMRQDWSGRGSHADFDATEQLPFEQGRSLGHGLNGEVFKVSCQGVDLALKRVYQRQKLQKDQMHEIDILKSISHRHIVDLVGTFYQKPYLGLLIWPVATCDLAFFLETWSFLETDAVKKTGQRYEPYGDRSEHVVQFCQDRYMDKDTLDYISEDGVCYALGYLTSAVAYLHRNNIRHKDIKPSNILLVPGRIWLTDFGSAKDFTDDLTSGSESRNRGTLRYCAPEVASYERSGRAADVFSLGCVFLEVAVLFFSGHRRNELDKLRPAMPGSYEANLDQVEKWLVLVDDGIELFNPDVLGAFRNLIRRMLDAKAYRRPKAQDIALHLTGLNDQTNFPLLFCGRCIEWTNSDPVVTHQKLRNMKREMQKVQQYVLFPAKETVTDIRNSSLKQIEDLLDI